MRIHLEVVEGPNLGGAFHFSEPDCFLVGRDAQGSAAHLRLGADDVYVSRNHFLLEIRPPHCYIRDNRSKNGTSLKSTGNGGFHPVGAGRLADGDLIRVGRTVLRFRVEADPGEEGPPSGEPHAHAGSLGRAVCVRCGSEVGNLLRAAGPAVQRVDGYVCGTCQSQAGPFLRPPEAAQGAFPCSGCGADVSRNANKDGRAAELADAAGYLCDACAVAAQRETDIAEVRDYLVLEEKGRGAMGVVYKAWHGPTGRLVALKKLLPESQMSEKAVLLFQREISVMRDIVHPRIVRLIDNGFFDGAHFLVSEYVAGGNVDDRMARAGGRLPAAEACGIVLQLLNALEYAHGKGYVHRDLKPRNLLLADGRTDPSGAPVAKISDFGLSKSFQNAGQSGITRLGESSGTLFFMAPEQITNYRFVKPPADTYSVGISLYYMLTGRYPFDFPSPQEQIRGLLKGRQAKDPVLIILEDKPLPVRERDPSLPKALADVVDKAVRKAEQKRFQTAADFRDALSASFGRGA